VRAGHSFNTEHKISRSPQLTESSWPSRPSKAPEFILYMPQKEMGVGLPRFSDKAQLMKWNALMRYHAVGGDPAPSTDDFRTISPPKLWPRQKPMVIRSAVEWFAKSGLAPCCRDPDANPRHEQSHGNTSIADLAEDLRL
jgi:hypothetical protein